LTVVNTQGDGEKIKHPLKS